LFVDTILVRVCRGSRKAPTLGDLFIVLALMRSIS